MRRASGTFGVRGTWWPGAVLALLAGVRIVAGEGPESRGAVPDPAARANAATELRKEQRAGFESKDPEVRRALARTLLERADGAETDALHRYVLLDQAVALAEGVRDVRLALSGVERLAAAFQVDEAPRGLTVLENVTRGAKDPSVVAEAAAACVELAGVALGADDAGAAARAVGMAKTFAKTAKLPGLVARATEVGALVDAFKRSASAAVAARKALEAAPDDPAANEALGRFVAFGRGRWEEGLPSLAKAGGPLGELAAKALAPSDEAASRQALADGWWDLGQQEKDVLARARMLARAAAAYEAAPTEASAERATLVKGRLDAITYRAFGRGVALTKDFSKDGPMSLALGTVRAFLAREGIDRRREGWRTRLPRFPDVAFARGEEYQWRLETSQGVITLRLFPDTAPQHVANVIYLSELGFYDGLTFHRVVSGFMAQGGCPTGSGSGNPGYTFASELGGGRKHDKPGVLSMANTGQPSSDGSQFFVTFRPAPELDGKHTVFGEVVAGMDVVKKLEAQGGPDPGTPKIPLRILTARILVR